MLENASFIIFTDPKDQSHPNSELRLEILGPVQGLVKYGAYCMDHQTGPKIIGPLPVFKSSHFRSLNNIIESLTVTSRKARTVRVRADRPFPGWPSVSETMS